MKAFLLAVLMAGAALPALAEAPAPTDQVGVAYLDGPSRGDSRSANHRRPAAP